MSGIESRHRRFDAEPLRHRPDPRPAGLAPSASSLFTFLGFGRASAASQLDVAAGADAGRQLRELLQQALADREVARVLPDRVDLQRVLGMS